jgi:hypothetical protein
MEIKDLNGIKEIIFIEQIRNKLEKLQYNIYCKNNLLIIKIFNTIHIFYDIQLNIYEIYIISVEVLKTSDIKEFLKKFNLIYSEYIRKEKQ